MRYNSIDIVQKRTKKFKGGYSMSHRLLANTEYFRSGAFKVLKTKQGNIFVGHYITKNDKENERIKKVFDLLCEENDKEKGNMTIEDVIDMVKKKYHVSIDLEDIPRPETKPYEKPHPRKVCLKITQISCGIKPQKMKEA